MIQDFNSPQSVRGGQGSGALAVAEYLVRLRRRIAPPGSLRERFLRAIYVPFLDRVANEAFLSTAGATPNPIVVQWRGITARGRSFPARPRILILKLDQIGDFVVAIPAFEHLRATWPDANVTLVCGPWNQAMAENAGLFDAVIPFDFSRHQAQADGTSAICHAAFEALRLGAFDLAIDLRHDTDSRSLLAQVDAMFRAGFCAPPKQGGECLDIALPDMEHISVAAGTGRPLHAELRLQLLAHAVTEVFAPRFASATRLTAPMVSRPPERPYVIIAPGAGSEIRVWPIHRLIEVCRAIADRYGLKIVVTGSSAERASAEAIVQALPGRDVTDCAGVLRLTELPTLISAASLYIGYDTGTTHLAASLGTPTVAILSGVPNLEVWHPVGKNVVVVAGRTACSPCYFKHAFQCRYDVACLMAITTDDVLAACDALLTRPPMHDNASTQSR